FATLWGFITAPFVAIWLWLGTTSFLMPNWVWVVIFYLPIGIVWMFFKWYTILNEWEDDFVAGKKKFIRQHKLNINVTEPIPPSHRQVWEKTCFDFVDVAPSLKHEDDRLMAHMGFWPVSMVHFALTGLRRVCNII